jgi:hypothetical protein
MTQPEDNVDVFEAHPTYAVAGILPDRSRVDEVLEALRPARDGVSDVEIMHGADGVRILDRRGATHGVGARLRRLLQNWTYYEQILLLYTDALNRGEFLIVIPTAPQSRHLVGGLLQAHRGHAVYYFGFNTVESISGP